MINFNSTERTDKYLKKKMFLTAMTMVLLLGMCTALNVEAANDDYAWLLVEKQYYDMHMNWDDDFSHSPLGEREYIPDTGNHKYYYDHNEQRLELRRWGEGRNPSFPATNIHTIYTWNAPPEVVQAGGTISFTVNQEWKNASPVKIC